MGSEKNFYVVGIGASAGGLEAIEAFFSKVPADSGLAYVIIQHLSPDYKSLMPEILLKRTSLPVHTVEDGMEVLPDNIYLIPRKMNMKIFHSKLHLTEKNSLHVLNLPIDIFFHSLAEDFEDKAIGVILSGTGSDGSRGIRVIKENGGIIMVQDPDSAKFDGMPKSAITTGTVDFILPPQEIPAKIISYVKHPYIKDKNNGSETAIVPEDYLSKIILLLKEAFGLDFTYYKDTTISRRVERRLSINQIDNLKNYLEYLYSSKNEQKTLYKELLIGVTKFFRDIEAFHVVETEIIPAIFQSKTAKDEIRVWISACSTGEEAYSIAILLKEYMLEHNLTNDIKIFATDVDRSAIEYASIGVYNASITADVSIDRLNRFFIQAGDSFKINDDIREMIVFATHNVIKDPPFNKIDFLLCRNLLIYFQTALQQKVLSLFNFALNKWGFLFLGSSETVGEMEHYYESVNLKWKIFKSKRTSKLPGDILSTKFPTGLINPHYQIRRPVYTLKSPINDLVNIFTEKIIEDNAPETVIVNENYEVINSFGDLNKYLIFPKTKRIQEGFEYIITKMVPSNLKLTFSIAVNKAIKNNHEVVHHNIRFEHNDQEIKIVDLKFVPLIRDDLSEKFVIIYFSEKETRPISDMVVRSFDDMDQQAMQRIYDLENELKHTKENLQASIEELETTNEELQSTNEELISANEELQSTNEELQSVNEELYTVNTEFQAKNHDLTVMNNDMENLLQTSEVRIIFLDLELKIRKFTENISDIFNLKKNDQGRPLSDITHHIHELDLLGKVDQIFKNHVKVQENILAKDKWYQMQILPYLTQKGFMDGVVISFVDINDILKAQSDLSKSEKRLNKVIGTEFYAFYLLKSKKDRNGNITEFIINDINKQAENQMNMTREELVGCGICELFPINLTNGFFEIYKNVAETQVPFEQEYFIPGEFQAPGWYYQQIVPDDEGIIIFNRDITHRKITENELVETKNLYQTLFRNMAKGFALHQIITNSDGQAIDYRFIDINDSFERITGLKRDAVIGKTVREVIPNIEDIWIERYAQVALHGEHLFFEQESAILNKRFRVNAYSPKKGQFATLFEEIQKK
jgi:two-component system, chemotaxis family, CheB/CheR fusion protein